MRGIIVIIALLVFKAFIIGGCAYLVFWRGESGWWFLLAIMLSSLELKIKPA